ncbi:MAG: hypothetical protein IPJ23_03655 [Ignavibacteriales bacterium]|nr:hypothetical protein [Ignavibacteriales bacterium]
MTKDYKDSDEDDLSAFADYLAEFKSVIGFDDETCVVCGINISDSISIQKSPFVQYKSVNKESELLIVTNELYSKCIPYKIEKQLDSTTLDVIQYKYIVLIPFKYLNEI